MEVDASAPAVARAEISVAAPRDAVWEVLTDIEAWPSWNRDVTSASLDGELARGTRFRWKAGPGTITSTLRHVESPRLIAWSGTTFGIKAIHVHRLEERDGATIVTSEESWDGLLVRLLRRRLANTLDESIRSGLQHLKAEAERRAGLPPTP